MKLVRDNAPNVLKSLGRERVVVVLGPEEFEHELRVALQELTLNYLKDPDLDLLIDLTEVLRALAATVHDADVVEFERLRRIYAVALGNYTKRYAQLPKEQAGGHTHLPGRPDETGTG